MDQRLQELEFLTGFGLGAADDRIQPRQDLDLVL